MPSILATLSLCAILLVGAVPVAAADDVSQMRDLIGGFQGKLPCFIVHPTHIPPVYQVPCD